MVPMCHRGSRIGAFLLLAGAVGVLAGCRGEEQGVNASQNADSPAQPATNIATAIPVSETMDRAALVDAVRLAASASATGSPDGDVQRTLDGRQFEVRVRFGCSGPSESLKSAALGWSFDQARRTLRVRAAPTISADQPDIVALAPNGTEAVEGFWIPRPWIVSAACPKAPAPQPASDAAAEKKEQLTHEPAEQQPQAVSPSGARIGIAEFFSASDARTGRRDRRAYESTKVLEEGRSPNGEGFNLVLSGRLRSLPGGKVISCTAAGPDTPPNCIVSADFDQVWIEWPEDRQVVAQWSRS